MHRPPDDRGAHVDAHGRSSHDPGQMGPLLAGDTRPMGDEPPDPILAGHETAEVRVAPAAKFMIGLGIAAGIVFVLMFVLLKVWREADTKAAPALPALVEANRGRLPPEPRLQVTPLIDYEVFHAAQESLLRSYGWADRDSGRVRIPIEAAMDLVISRGLPVRAGGATAGEAHGQPGVGEAPAPHGAEPTGRLPRGDLRLRPPASEVEPAPAHSEGDTAHRRGGNQ